MLYGDGNVTQAQPNDSGGTAIDASSFINKRKAITLKDIAKHCGVSIFAVSRALNDKPGISVETCARIRAAAQELGYDPARYEAARRLALRKHGRDLLNHEIALLFPPEFYKAHYFSEIFQGLLAGLMPPGFALLTAHLEEPKDASSRISLPPTFSRGDIDGVVSFAGPKTFSALERTLRETSGFGNRPIVSVIWQFPDHSCVLTDDEYGAYLASKHLLELGHRHLLHFFYPSFGEKQDRRLGGVNRALAEFNLTPDHLQQYEVPYIWFDPCQISTGETVPSAHARTERLRKDFVRFMRSHPEITAILALNDTSALQAWYALQNSGVRVPEDVSIIGFDDTDAMYDRSGRNMLATVRLPLREVGLQAAKLIIAQVTAEKSEPREIMLPTTLLIRESTAPPARRAVEIGSVTD